MMLFQTLATIIYGSPLKAIQAMREQVGPVGARLLGDEDEEEEGEEGDSEDEKAQEEFQGDGRRG